MEPSNYAAWNVPLHRWDSVAAFTDESRWLSGIHIVGLPNGNHLDVLLQSDPLDPARDDSVAVFFSGALPNRSGKLGPYFSGARVAQSLNIPFIAFSDPSLNLNGDIPLGWYAGSQNDDSQDAITRILKSAAEKSGRDLLLIGGSAGGFASLYFAHRVGKQASAFVWNPQTSIVDYEVGAVRNYLDVAVPGSAFGLRDSREKEQTVATLLEHGIEAVLPRSEAGRVFYLQNSTDWHVSKHLKPYLERNAYTFRGNGYYSNSHGHSVIISNFGVGHAVPPAELIEETIKRMLRPRSSTRAIYNELIEDKFLSAVFHDLPRDMREEWNDELPPFAVDLSKVSGRCIASVNWRQYRAGAGGIKVAFNVYDTVARIQFSALSTDFALVIDSPETAHRIDAIFVDGFDHRLGVVSTTLEPAHSLPGDATGHSAGATYAAKSTGDRIEGLLPKVFVYGSCVSRDAFQEPDAPVLVDYIARSSLGSAFTTPSGLSASVSLDLNPSAFQRRMVNTDLDKKLASLITSAEFDFLLVDFIDERLQLIRSASGYDTYSPELSRTGFDVDPMALVEPGSDEYMVAFKNGWDRLMELVPAEKIVINRVFWATHDESGRELKEFANISENNDILSRLYEHVCTIPSVRVIDYTADELKADPFHKWGCSPFHFSKKFYEKTACSLASILKAERATSGAAPPAPSTTVLVETLFCDYERSPNVLSRLSARFLHSLESIAAQLVSGAIDLRYIIYLSSDKTAERTAFESLIGSFPDDVSRRFYLVSYDHPEAGYGYSSDDHIDLYKNPNKHAPRRDRLFDAALMEMPKIQSPQIVRVGLDDDDVLLPWQIAEIVRVAEHVDSSFPDHEMFVVGLQNSYVAYVGDPIEVDEVQISRIMSGNKFIFGPTSQLHTLRNCSPWSIPEVFSENSRDRMLRAGLFMVQTSDNLPGYVYMRWGDNLTQARKDVYYERVIAKRKLHDLGDIHHMNRSSIVPASTPSFSIRPREFEIFASRIGDDVVEIKSNFRTMPEFRALRYTVHVLDGVTVLASLTGCEAESVIITGVKAKGVFAKAILFRGETAISTTRSRGVL